MQEWADLVKEYANFEPQLKSAGLKPTQSGFKKLFKIIIQYD